MAKQKQLTVKFTKEKETINKVRFQEEFDGEPVIDKLYVSKVQLKKIGNPEKLTLTIDPT